MTTTTTENEPPPASFGSRADTIKTESAEWLLAELIALKQVNENVGDPDRGKTLFAIDVAAHVTTGANWPDWSACPQGHVLYFSAEDDPSTTIKPRLLAAGADLKHVTIISMLWDSAGKGDWDDLAKLARIVFPEQFKRLEDMMRRLAVKLIIFDPLSAYISSKLDFNKETHARYIYGLLAEIARRNNIAVIVLGHLNKNSAVGNASYRTIGSVARTAAPRTSYLVDLDPSDRDTDPAERRRVFARIKNNLSKCRDGLTFKIESVNVTLDDGTVADVPRIAWVGTTKLSADEVLAAGDPSHRKRTAEVDRAHDFLKAALAAGPRPKKEIKAAAEDAGITDSSLKRARKQLGVESRKVGLRGPWFLSLPGSQNANANGKSPAQRRRNAHLRAVTGQPPSSAKEGQNSTPPK